MILSIPHDELNEILSTYRNSRDSDIEEFLQKKALIYENRHWCSTYVLVDESRFINGDIWIEGYFTLSHKVIEISETVSNNLRKRISNGLKKDDNFIHMILIGQLGKYVDEKDCVFSDISATDILDKAFEIIEEVNERIVSRCVMLECRKCLETDTEESKEKRQKLHKIYSDYGFKALQDDGELTQYYKII